MDEVHDDEEELEPPWPGWRAMVSGRAGVVALVVLIVVGYFAFNLVSEQQQQYNSPAHTQTACVQVPDSGDSPTTGPTQICGTVHN